MMMRRFVLIAACGVAVGLAQSSLSANDQRRPLQLDDRFREEEIGETSFASDGQALALVIRRPANTQPDSNGLRIQETRGDVWIQVAPGQRLRNITNGIKDNTGWWSARWSPSGRRLLFLSNRGGDVTLWQWDRATDKVSQVSPQPIDFDQGSFEWLDDERVICLAMPEDQSGKPMGRGGYFVGRGVELATENWARAARGELTAHVVKSLEFKYPLRYLMVLSVNTGRATRIGTTWSNTYQPRRWWLSHDKRLVAFVKPDASPYPGTMSRKFGTPANLEIKTTDGQPITLQRPLPKNVLTARVQWAATENILTFFALDDAHVNPELLYGAEAAKDVVHEPSSSREQPARLWSVDASKGRVEELNTGDVDLGQSLLPPSFTILENDRLLFRAPRLSHRLQTRSKQTTKWLTLSRHGETDEWGFDPVLDRIESMEAIGADAFITLVDGEVWKVDGNRRVAANLTATLSPRILSIKLAEPGKPLAFMAVGESKSESDRVLLRLGFPPSSAEIFSLDARTGLTKRLAKPAAEATLEKMSSASKSVVFKSNTLNGTVLWRAEDAGTTEKIMVANEWRKILKPVEIRVFEYTVGNGEVLKAVLTLPHGYEKGRRVPIVVDSDINYTSSRAPYMYDDSEGFRWMDLIRQLSSEYSAAGFGYLWVSVPTATGMDEVGRANLLMLTQGVLPAVDKAVELGYADRDRVFIDGHSSFGYGVYGIVTQTARFKAASARAGWVDQTTLALSTDFISSRTDNPFDYMFTGGFRGYSASDLPFWKNGDHYRRNSPLSYVDRVKTPLLIVHGEMDVVEVTNAEMFFKALAIQRKPAELVRYWGEGHVIRTPVNYVDSYLRIFAWFDRWGDISRDASGAMIYEGDRVKSRNGSAPRPLEDYWKFDVAGSRGNAQGTRSAQNN